MDFQKIPPGFRSSALKSSLSQMPSLLNIIVQHISILINSRNTIDYSNGIISRNSKSLYNCRQQIVPVELSQRVIPSSIHLILSEDFQSFSDSSQTLLAVRLIPPRPGVFLPSISFLLALCTSSTFFLLGIDTTPADGTFTLYNADMSVSVSAMGIKCIEATKDGRIFIAGGDGHLWEIMYQAEEGWFTSRTRKVCQTAGFGELIIPHWGAAPETIEQIAIDDSRKLLYTLGSKSTIKTFHLNSPTTLTQVISYSFSSVLSHIQILSANSPLLDPKTTTIVEITPIQAAESGRIYLVATTNTRVRLYIRAIKGYGSFGGTNDPVNSMQVIHVRFPPEQQTGQFSVFPNTSLTDISLEISNHVISPSCFILGYFLRLTNQPIPPTEIFCSPPP